MTTAEPEAFRSTGCPISESETANPPFGVHSVESELVGNGNMNRLLIRNLRESRSDFSFTFLFAFLADVTNRSIVKC